MPPPEFAEHGVYCTGDECHKIAPKWERPRAEVTPPKSSITAVWSVEGFGEGKGSGGKNAPIHFGDTTPATDEFSDNESKLAPKTPAKTVEKKVAGSNGKSSNGKGKAAAAVAKNGARGSSTKTPPKAAPAPQGKRR